MYPSQVCYADGIIKGGIFTKGSKCIRNGLYLLVRLLPIELYPLDRCSCGYIVKFQEGIANIWNNTAH